MQRMNGYKNDLRSLFIILCAAQYSTMLKGLALFAALLAVSAAARLQAYVPEMVSYVRYIRDD